MYVEQCLETMIALVEHEFKVTVVQHPFIVLVKVDSGQWLCYTFCLFTWTVNK